MESKKVYRVETFRAADRNTDMFCDDPHYVESFCNKKDALRYLRSLDNSCPKGHPEMVVLTEWINGSGEHVLHKFI